MTTPAPVSASATDRKPEPVGAEMISGVAQFPPAGRRLTVRGVEVEVVALLQRTIDSGQVSEADYAALVQAVKDGRIPVPDLTR